MLNKQLESGQQEIAKFEREKKAHQVFHNSYSKCPMQHNHMCTLLSVYTVLPSYVPMSDEDSGARSNQTTAATTTGGSEEQSRRGVLCHCLDAEIGIIHSTNESSKSHPL